MIYEDCFISSLLCQKKKEVAQRGAGTHDPEIKSLMLYRLSQPGVLLGILPPTMLRNVQQVLLENAIGQSGWVVHSCLCYGYNALCYNEQHLFMGHRSVQQNNSEAVEVPKENDRWR